VKNVPRIVVWYHQTRMWLDLRCTLVRLHLGRRLRQLFGRFKIPADECGSWHNIRTSAVDREWWLLVDHILHASERLPIPNFVWELGGWRYRFCHWCLMRYLPGPHFSIPK